MRAGDVAATFRSPPTPWRRKRNRLEADRYVGNAAYFLTLATDRRHPHFTDAGLVGSCTESLNQACRIEGFALLAYVFMPDHVHLLLRGTDGSRLANLVKRFKQQTSFRYRRATQDSLWQKSYYDHVLRRDEDLNDVAVYIAWNPVEAGLVDSGEDYAFKGGLLLDGAPSGDLKVATTTANGLHKEIESPDPGFPSEAQARWRVS